MTQLASEEEKKQYEAYVKEVTPTHSLLTNMVRAFLAGGLICVLGQGIINFAVSRGLDQETAGTWCSVLPLQVR